MASIIKANELQDFGGNSIITSDGAGVVTPNATGIKNTPAFHVSKTTANQSLSDNTNAKVTFDTELFDSDNNFASNKFTPTTAGKYYLYAQAYLANNNPDIGTIELAIYKNGSLVAFHQHDHRTEMVGYNQVPNIMTIVDANGSSDYFEVYAKADVTSASSLQVYGLADGYTYFNGYKLIGA